MDCHKWIANPTKKDVWKGHICTAEVHKFQSPFLRALLRKGHTDKMEMSEETLLQEVAKGLDGYIDYKAKHTGDPTPYMKWRHAVLTRIKVELRRGGVTMYPNGEVKAKDIDELHQDMVFLKEDRAPHVAVAMCKHRYMLERQKYVLQDETFEVATEIEDEIIGRRVQYHNDKGLQPNKNNKNNICVWHLEVC